MWYREVLCRRSCKGLGLYEESTVWKRRGTMKDIEYESIRWKHDKEQAGVSEDDSATKGRESTVRILLTHERPNF